MEIKYLDDSSAGHQAEKLYRKWINWLKSLRPQKKIEWTSEDIERYESCLKRLGTGNPEQPETVNSKWFREHVSPQKQWKPSETELSILSGVISGEYNPKDFQATLQGILAQLKALNDYGQRQGSENED